MGKLERPLSAKKAIGALELLALLGAILHEVRNGHAMPRPAMFGAVFLFYGLLGVAAEIGGQAARIAFAIAGVTTLGALVTGAAGKDILSTLKTFTRYIGAAGGSSTTTAPAPAGGPQPI